MSNNQISTATNVTAPDLSNANLDARKYFNNLYSIDFSVGASNDAIVAFFEQYTKNSATAKNLASAVLYSAISQNLDPMAVLAEFQNLPAGQLNSYLTALLNTNRVPTSTLALKSTSSTNPYVLRTILA